MATHRRRGKNPRHWYIVVYVGRGKYRWYPFEGSEAEAKRAAIRHQVDKFDGKLRPASTMRVTDLLDAYLATKLDIEPTTAAAYRTDVAHLKARLGEVRLGQLSGDHLEEFVRASLSDGNRRTGQALARKTVRNRLALLLSALEYARGKGWIATNYRSAVRLPKPASASSINPLTREEAAAWLAALKGDARLVPVVLGLGAGLRRGEIAALRRCDVDLGAQIIHVRQSRWQVGSQSGIKAPKTRSSRRSIPIPAFLVTILANHFAAQDQISSPPVGQRDERLVFAHANGAPYHLDWLSVLPGTIAADFGLRRIRFHDLRHSCATLLLEAGVSMNQVARILGHADVTITVRLYGHVTAVSDRLARQALDAIARGEDPERGAAA